MNQPVKKSTVSDASFSSLQPQPAALACDPYGTAAGWHWQGLDWSGAARPITLGSALETVLLRGIQCFSGETLTLVEDRQRLCVHASALCSSTPLRHALDRSLLQPETTTQAASPPRGPQDLWQCILLVSRDELEADTSGATLVVCFDPQQGQVKCGLPDDTSAGKAWLALFARRLQAGLEALERLQADALLADLDLHCPGEARRIARQLQGPPSNVQIEVNVAEVFRRCAQQWPDHLALHYEDARLSYAALAGRAAAIASQLSQAGVYPGDHVALLMPDCPDTLATLLACAALGAVFVPLNPQHPAARLQACLEQASPRQVVVAAGMAAPAGVPSLYLQDGELPAAAFQAVALPAGAPLYLLFTSGSTGQPKGVLVPHRGLVRLAADQDLCPLQPGDAVGHAAPLTFDLSMWEVWAPLLNGATLVHLPENTATDAAAFRAWAARHAISHLFPPVSLFDSLLIQDPQVFNGLRHIMVGADLVHPETCRTLLNQPRPPRLVNCYGPTECSVYALAGEITLDSLERTHPQVAVGTPIAATCAWILDERQQPLPYGATGTLWLGGPALALGYLNDPLRTAAAFQPVPGQPGALRYCTGDLAILTEQDGVLCLGRQDFQLKVRGFRIEPGEIENHLYACPGVVHAAICGQTDPQRQVTALVAFLELVPGTDADALVRQARAHLGRHLPDYMIPGCFECLPALPRNLSGKIDRSALARQAIPATAVEQDDRPGAPLPERVLQLFRHALQTQDFNADDHFLECGGHSLSAARIATRLQQRFGRLPPMPLFAQPRTVHEITLYLRLSGVPDARPSTADSSPAAPHETLYL